ncbi:MAG: radical SAM protein [Aestuariivita sp.]|nr:radical SAM protein [Aestuariivita sp.]
MEQRTPEFAKKFSDCRTTVKGLARAYVGLTNPTTIWFNTGTLCNIACQNCYIASSPTNDSLVYLTADEVLTFLNELEMLQWGVSEIGFTGGEPFLNPQFLKFVELALERNYQVLILTNAMRPMMRQKIQDGLLKLNDKFNSMITIRVSVDHHLALSHDIERGSGSFYETMKGMRWLTDNGFKITVAGRMKWTESELEARDGFNELFMQQHFNVNAYDPAELVLFPEMNMSVDVPEISTDCWQALNLSPRSVMCASSRMVIKRKGAERPAVVSCTLLPYDETFELGNSLTEADQKVFLNHPYCAQFCVLGGASCSA